MACIMGFYEALDIVIKENLPKINLRIAENIYGLIPLSQYGLGWIIPSVLGFLFGAYIVKLKEK